MLSELGLLTAICCKIGGVSMFRDRLLPFLDLKHKKGPQKWTFRQILRRPMHFLFLLDFSLHEQSIGLKKVTL